MTTIDASAPDVGPQRGLIEQAAQLGFSLDRRTADTGQTVWEWRRGDEPRPQFVTERVAIHWMSEWLDRHAGDDRCLEELRDDLGR
jgi:hypothetical protein